MTENKGKRPRQTRAERIASLNDAFRKGLPNGGRVYLTQGINERGAAFVAKALAAVIACDDFNQDNDPYGEHDFGAVAVAGEKIFWKIDYYDLKGQFGSEEPEKPAKTLRVLTIMFADEY